MTKLSYSQKLGKYVVTELGRLIDSDDDFDAIGIRHGFLSDDSTEAMTDALLDTDTDATDDDDLALINDLLFNDHDTPTNLDEAAIG